jgi:hypothetical protein
MNSACYTLPRRKHGKLFLEQREIGKKLSPCLYLLSKSNIQITCVGRLKC